ncbi:hypothetical protein C4D60_Mb11t02160 [Musa balbisiana]|uniref:Uncharacterized protein n=1 Tax=Musa balbisiana TaxID=52838 RepID=A0A4S8J1Y8_MUSBA|nr:hypothetical protein C4D60_Mb11t02160 [Musa balbisiana]
MINIFDLSAGMAGTKMLPERHHRNGITLGFLYISSESVLQFIETTLMSTKPPLRVGLTQITNK